MKLSQSTWDGKQWRNDENLSALNSENTLVLIFGELATGQGAIEVLQQMLPNALFTGCSTAGEVSGLHVKEGALVATVIHFEKTKIKMINHKLFNNDRDQKEIGASMAKQLMKSPKLRHVFLLSDGLHVNGCQLTEGFECALPDDIKVTGGLAGDYENFKQTLLLCQEEVADKQIVAIGFYGDSISVSYGSRGGWSSFGLKRKITRSEGNVLFELDDENALDIYKSYLGELSANLPASGLRFPLEICVSNKTTKLVRTLLGINETVGSITFAGNVPKDATAMLMRANVETLIDGAKEAAKVCKKEFGSPPPTGNFNKLRWKETRINSTC